jgi:hypothetical protein
MRENSKSYSNEEFIFRWNVWRENQQFIDEHNRSNKTFFLAMNQFGDLTNAEFNKIYKGLAFDYSTHAAKKIVAEKVAPALNLPADFDWRQKGAVTHVKNQGTFVSFRASSISALDLHASSSIIGHKNSRFFKSFFFDVQVSAARAGRSPPLARLRVPTSSRPAVSTRSLSRTSSIAPARTATTAATAA